MTINLLKWKIMSHVYLSSIKRSLDFKKKIDQSYFSFSIASFFSFKTSNIYEALNTKSSFLLLCICQYWKQRAFHNIDIGSKACLRMSPRENDWLLSGGCSPLKIIGRRYHNNNNNNNNNQDYRDQHVQ